MTSDETSFVRLEVFFFKLFLRHFLSAHITNQFIHNFRKTTSAELIIDNLY